MSGRKTQFLGKKVDHPGRDQVGSVANVADFEDFARDWGRRCGEKAEDQYWQRRTWWTETIP